MIQYRWVFCFLISIGVMTLGALSSTMNVSIVAMVHPDLWETETRISSECRGNNSDSSRSTRTTSTGEFFWTPYTQGIILGADGYGSIVTCFLGGYLASKYGGKWVLGIGILFVSMFSCLTPVAARAGVPTLLSVRAFLGLFQGFLTSTYFQLFANWAPITERGVFSSFISVGHYLGSGLASALAGWFSSREDLGGWSTIFYVTGICGVVWFLFWSIFGYNSPETHPRISQEEAAYILKSRGSSTDNISVPWKAIALSRAFWSYVIALICVQWLLQTFEASMPLYLDTVINLPIHYNGLLNGLNYLSNCIGTFVGGISADIILRKYSFKVTTVRKMMCTIALLGGTICYLSIPLFGGCNTNIVMFLMFSAKFLLAMNNGGLSVNLIDIAPKYCGVMSGVAYTLTYPGSFLCPLVTGIIINEDVTRENWLIVFLIASSLAIFGLVVFLLFGSAEVQPWATISEVSSESHDKSFSESTYLLNGKEKTSRFVES